VVASPKNGAVLGSNQALTFTIEVDSTAVVTPPELRLSLQNRHGVRGGFSVLLPITILNFVRLKEVKASDSAQFWSSDELFECEMAIQSLDLVDSFSSHCLSRKTPVVRQLSGQRRVRQVHLVARTGLPHSHPRCSPLRPERPPRPDAGGYALPRPRRLDAQRVQLANISAR